MFGRVSNSRKNMSRAESTLVWNSACARLEAEGFRTWEDRVSKPPTPPKGGGPRGLAGTHFSGVHFWGFSTLHTKKWIVQRSAPRFTNQEKCLCWRTRRKDSDSKRGYTDRNEPAVVGQAESRRHSRNPGPWIGAEGCPVRELVGTDASSRAKHGSLARFSPKKGGPSKRQKRIAPFSVQASAREGEKRSERHRIFWRSCFSACHRAQYACCADRATTE